jgi:crossover junction endodeoxyribonuclease RuvC
VRIFGVDPGLTRCGLAVVEAKMGQRGKLIHLEVAQSDPKLDPAERLYQIAERIDFVLDQYKPEAVSLERVFAQQNLRTVMGVAQVGGITLLAAQRRNIPAVTYSPTAVKAAVTGHGRSNKQQVAKMVTTLLNLTEIPKPADATDAIALALCHAWRVHHLTAAQAPFSPRRVAKVKRS